VLAAVFTAMASPCEVLVETDDRELAARLGAIVAGEAHRIEAKFSRYRADSVVSELNRSAGRSVVLDEETAALIAFAARCHTLSQGAFDITSGVLRAAWRFDGSNRVPGAAEVEALRARVGFGKLRWDPPSLAVPADMEIDLGGIGKEYAVDRALGLASAAHRGALLVNFGGDLAASGPTRHGPWSVGIERPGTDREARLVLDLSRGALATSGDTRRFIERDGVRYGHILDVRTGWPVQGAPRSVTVAGASCVEAGLLATLAMLKGPGAEAFLGEQAVDYWCLR
jgi:thiamine biosynthesis lipoprotein